MAVAVVVEGPPCQGGAGSGGLGVGNPSASGERCDVGRAGAACAETGLSVAAGTGVWGRAAGTAPGWPRRWATAGPADVGAGTGPSAAAAEDSWDCCAGLVTPQGPDAAAAAGEASGGGPVGAGPEKMEVGARFEGAEGPEVAAEDLLHPLHLALHRPLAGQPWHSAAASGGGAGAGAYAGVQLRPAAGPQTLGNPAPAGLGDHQAAGAQEVDLRVGPDPL